MKFVVKVGYIILSLGLLAYLAVPNVYFPAKSTEALQSDEPADTESIYRRAYFTNLNREEVMEHYVNEMRKTNNINFPLPTYRLNYPPEEAQTIIRDQTRSTYLEEVVHPFRESIFVNGFEPKTAKDAIKIQNKLWEQKIIIKQINSNVYVRLGVGLLSIIFIPIIFKNVSESIIDLKKYFARLWIYR